MQAVVDKRRQRLVPTFDIQLDGRIRIALAQTTEDVGVFAGMSMRY